MAMGKHKRKGRKPTRRSTRKSFDHVPIPVALVDGIIPSSSVEFTDVPDSIQSRVEEILRANGLIPSNNR